MVGTIELDAHVEDAMLQVRINNTRPIDLIDYAQSMLNLGNEYSSFINKTDIHLSSDDIKLYVKEIRTGSIITELVAIAPTLMPFMEHSNTVLDFANHIKVSFDYLLGKGSKPQDLDKDGLKRISKFVEPIANDNGSVMQIDASNNKGEIHIHLNSEGANAIQNRAHKELEKMKEPVIGLHKQVVLYWSQARNDNKKGDKAVIESISDREVKVIYDTEELKYRMIHEQPHIFDTAYVVDVYVETIRDKPVVYKIVAFHDTVEIPD